MTWIGYFEFDGNEVINSHRTERYARALPWFRPAYRNEDLGPILGHDTYLSPLLDDAPWVDPSQPESVDFYGCYPLDVSGVEDSTRSSAPVESLVNGGVPGRLRHTTRTVVFSVLLIASTEKAADYGMRWLRETLTGGACGGVITDTGLGGTMCYLSSEPELEEVPEHGFTDLPAVLDGGYFIDGEGLLDTDADGGDASTESLIDFDGANAPTEGGAEVDGGSAGLTGGGFIPVRIELESDDVIVDGGTIGGLPDQFLDGGAPGNLTPPMVTDPVWPFDAFDTPVPNPVVCLPPYQRTLNRVLVNSGPTVSAKNVTSDGGQAWAVTFTAITAPFEIGAEVPVLAGFGDPDVDMVWADGEEPIGGSTDPEGFILVEEPCVETVSEPLYDPLDPAVLPPPSPSTVPLGNFRPPVNWRRRQFTIPAKYVPNWGEVVPKMQIHARTADLRSLRLRFYADPYATGDVSGDPCAYCGDIVVSYIPRNHSLVLDGPEEQVYIVTPGGIRRGASSLVFKTNGTPFEWPELSCGFGYVVTLDLPQTQPVPVVDLSLFARTAA